MRLAQPGRFSRRYLLQHTYLGYNYRLDEMSAALGCRNVPPDELLDKRSQVANWYAGYLSKIDEVTAPELIESTTRASWFVYVIKVDKSADRDRFALILEEKGVPVRPYFSPIHLQPFMQEMFGFESGDYPVTEDLGNRSLALPFSGRMTEEEVKSVCERIVDA